MLFHTTNYARSFMLLFLCTAIFLAACSDNNAAAPVKESSIPTSNSTATVLPTPSVTPSPTEVIKGSLTVEPDSGDCNRYVIVRGLGFQEGAVIEPTLVIGSRSWSVGITITIPADGAFVYELPILRHPECRHGEKFRIVAKDTRVPRTAEELDLLRMPDAEAIYSVANPTPPPSLTLSAASGPCDAAIEVIGTGLPAHAERVQVALIGLGGGAHPSLVLGKANVDVSGQFRVYINFGADGCSFAGGIVPASPLQHLGIGIYDATVIPMLPIGRVEYVPTTSEPSREGDSHRNPRWTDRTCCI